MLRTITLDANEAVNPYPFDQHKLDKGQHRHMVRRGPKTDQEIAAEHREGYHRDLMQFKERVVYF